ncbi:MAG: GNAT family N-acetyltransferase [Oscillospiraceae bacterium]|jgi:predicted GNAT family acetyltransferase|nr:GNAT family N-acetyltransferase [Oscillospiraceae bacterium]
MTFTHYQSGKAFAADALEILLENEAQNNHLVNFAVREADKPDWLFASVKDDAGSVVLSAACTPPYNIVLYETGNKPNDEAVKLLSRELKAMGYPLPGVNAEQSLARRFAEAHTERFHRHMSMNIMRLDTLRESQKAPGGYRALGEGDLYWLPYWEYAFRVDCGIEMCDMPACAENCARRINSGYRFYTWEDTHPVSIAAHGRDTLNGAVVNFVYTPPHYRGKGYASSVVSALSRDLLDSGKTFCCLYADAQNPISCGIYRKLGYEDLCVFDDIKFA